MFYWIFRSFHSNESITISSPTNSYTPFVNPSPIYHHGQQQQLNQHGQSYNRMKGQQQINQQQQENQRKESIFHNNNSNNKKSVTTTTTLPVDKKYPSHSLPSLPSSSLSGSEQVVPPLSSPPSDPAISFAVSLDQSSFTGSENNNHNNNGNEESINNGNKDGRRKRRKREGKNSEESSLTRNSIINKGKKNKKLTAVSPPTTSSRTFSCHGKETSRQGGKNDNNIVLEGFKGKEGKKEQEEITFEQESEGGIRKKSDVVEHVTKLTFPCDDKDDDSGEYSVPDATADNGRTDDSIQEKWKRMRMGRNKNKKKNDTSMKGIRCNYHHISFNVTTGKEQQKYQINRNQKQLVFGKRRKRMTEKESDMVNSSTNLHHHHVITLNQEPISLPLTQSNVPLMVHSSPQLTNSFTDKENGGGHVDPYHDVSFRPLNHITEPDEELFSRDMALNLPLGSSNLNRESINSKLKYSSDGTRSWLYYTPMSKYDFGSFECWATNSIGKQSFPCLFTINAAGM